MTLIESSMILGSMQGGNWSCEGMAQQRPADPLPILQLVVAPAFTTNTVKVISSLQQLDKFGTDVTSVEAAAIEVSLPFTQ